MYLLILTYFYAFFSDSSECLYGEGQKESEGQDRAGQDRTGQDKTGQGPSWQPVVGATGVWQVID